MGNVALGHAAAPFGNRQHEGVAATVHGALLEGVTDLVAFGRTRAAESVVPSAGIGDNFSEYIALAGNQLRAGRKVNGPLFANGVLGGVPVGNVVCVVKQRVHSLIPFQVHNAEGLPAFDFVHPTFARGEGEIENALAGFNLLSVRMKVLIFRLRERGVP